MWSTRAGNEGRVHALADVTDICVIRTHRYETGSSQPTPEALRQLAKALRVSADTLVFDTDWS